jgi:hypothetical protein
MLRLIMHGRVLGPIMVSEYLILLKDDKLRPDMMILSQKVFNNTNYS